MLSEDIRGIHTDTCTFERTGMSTVYRLCKHVDIRCIFFIYIFTFDLMLFVLRFSVRPFRQEVKCKKPCIFHRISLRFYTASI